MRTRPPRALLLDLDDTILVYGPLGEDVWEAVTAEFAPRLGLEVASLRAAVREAASRYWAEPERSRQGRHDLRGARRTICLWALQALDAPRPERAAAMADAFHDEREARVDPLPGALDALEHFRARGLPLVLVTNGGPELQRRKIERFGLAGFFEAVLVEGELGFGKPDPRVFEQALAAVGVAPEQAWMVGDNLHADIQGAQAAGLHACWVDASGSGTPHLHGIQPTATVRALVELREWL
ncbi:MAG: HAD family hydrolase [bacterium]|nr:HAD family hydrolase [bacterium]MCP5067878.1 HAD family hydrolase [bacterium]